MRVSRLGRERRHHRQADRAPWDPLAGLPQHLDELRASDIYTLRRITGRDRGKHWETMSMKGVAIIGCGLIGQEAREGAWRRAARRLCRHRAWRAPAAGGHSAGCRRSTDWQRGVSAPDVDIVIIATLHDTLAEITHARRRRAASMCWSRSRRRAAPPSCAGLAEAGSRRNGALVRVGFNHRYHRAFRKARELVDRARSGR